VEENEALRASYAQNQGSEMKPEDGGSVDALIVGAILAAVYAVSYWISIHFCVYCSR